MTEIKPAPFGSRVKRFLPVGYHPALNAFPGTYKYKNIAPGRYNLQAKRKMFCKVPRWDQCLKDIDFSRNIAYRNDNVLKARLWRKSVNGPGWQDVSESVFIPGGTFRKTVRFASPKYKGFSVPGPGSYGKDHVPHTRLEEKSRTKGFSYSTLSFFERISGRSNLDFQLSYHLPPNMYKIKSSIDELISKRVSKRGPYDLFTGPRFPKVVVSKYAERPHFSKFFSNDLTHPKNAFKGKFLKCGKNDPITTRFVIIDPTTLHAVSRSPAPNYYDPYPLVVVAQSFHPFNSSAPASRLTVRDEDIPPPGRYNMEQKRRIRGDGFRSNFLSKTNREFFKRMKYSWFE